MHKHTQIWQLLPCYNDTHNEYNILIQTAIIFEGWTSHNIVHSQSTAPQSLTDSTP